jgi:hypothetical protein
VARANDTRYGLSGSVWSGDPDRAAAVAARLECGTAFVNDHLTLQPYMPFGGMKWSGMGVENGPWGLEEFTALPIPRLADHRVSYGTRSNRPARGPPGQVSAGRRAAAAGPGRPLR